MKKLLTILIITIFIGCAGETTPVQEVDIEATVQAIIKATAEANESFEQESQLEEESEKTLIEVDQGKEVVEEKEAVEEKIDESVDTKKEFKNLEEAKSYTWDEITDISAKAIVKIETEYGSGSGVIISLNTDNSGDIDEFNYQGQFSIGDGKAATILTSFHNIENSDSITVMDQFKNTYEGTIIGIDKERDFALIQICCSTELSSLEFSNYENLRLGQDVIALGYPESTNTMRVTKGVISGFDYWKSESLCEDCDYIKNIMAGSDKKISDVCNDCHLLQTDAALNPGNSGGPLINELNQIVGINSIKVVNLENTGFAISSKTFIKDNYLLNSLKKDYYNQKVNTESQMINVLREDLNLSLSYPNKWEYEENLVSKKLPDQFIEQKGSMNFKIPYDEINAEISISSGDKFKNINQYIDSLGDLNIKTSSKKYEGWEETIYEIKEVENFLFDDKLKSNKLFRTLSILEKDSSKYISHNYYFYINNLIYNINILTLENINIVKYDKVLNVLKKVKILNPDKNAKFSAVYPDITVNIKGLDDFKLTKEMYYTNWDYPSEKFDNSLINDFERYSLIRKNNRYELLEYCSQPMTDTCLEYYYNQMVGYNTRGINLKWFNIEWSNLILEIPVNSNGTLKLKSFIELNGSEIEDKILSKKIEDDKYIITFKPITIENPINHGGFRFNDYTALIIYELHISNDINQKSSSINVQIIE